MGSICVVDERGELFPFSQGVSCFDTGKKTDILTGCGKAQGIDMALRTMGPATIAVDEITAEDDCESLIRAGWCGVRLLATAHAASVEDLRSRPVYRLLCESSLFSTVGILSRDKSLNLERMAS
jgi:stage III sporulation protein AA